MNAMPERVLWELPLSVEATDAANAAADAGPLTLLEWLAFPSPALCLRSNEASHCRPRGIAATAIRGAGHEFACCMRVLKVLLIVGCFACSACGTTGGT